MKLQPAPDTATPRVLAVARRAGAGFVLAYRCAYCGREHRHGSPTPPAAIEHRLTHCAHPAAPRDVLLELARDAA